jgi:hypothetical protein
MWRQKELFDGFALSKSKMGEKEKQFHVTLIYGWSETVSGSSIPELHFPL